MSEEEGLVSEKFSAFRVYLYFEVFVLLVTGDRDYNLVDNILVLCVDDKEIGFDSHALLEVLTVDLGTSSGV